MIEFSSARQIVLSFLAVICFGIFGYAVVSQQYLQLLANARETQMSELRGELGELNLQREKLAVKLDDISENLRQKHNELASTIRQKLELRSRLTDLKEQLHSVVADRNAGQRDKTVLKDRIGQLEKEVRVAMSRTQEIAREAAAVQKSRDSTMEMVMALSRERDDALSEQMRLRGTIGQLQDHVSQLKTEQRDMMVQLDRQTSHNIRELERVVTTTGLDLWELLARSGGDGTATGGPFNPVPAVDPEKSGDIEFLAARPKPIDPVETLEDRIEHWTRLNDLLERIPLASPVENYRITSNFGRRRDPFSKRWAKHAGVDMVGGYRADIHATAPGKVVSVGWNGPYGRQIMIDHGNGIQTLYGHLRKILVKQGQEVSYYQKIGVMGSSGRSTGSHLHYEVRLDNKPINPIRFLKAGRDVFKG